jgi:hypothetical protein
MKAGELIDAIERFFLDIIGTIVPGMLLLVGWAVLFGSPNARVIASAAAVQGQGIWLFIISGYIIGHIVTGLGSIIVTPGPLTRSLRKSTLTRWIVGLCQGDAELTGEIAGKPTYQAFVDRATATMPWLGKIAADQVNDWRSVAMSLLTPQENHTVYRFMFISLLNLGTGTVIIVLATVWVIATLALKLSAWQPWSAVLFPDRRPLDWSVVIAGTIACAIVFERRIAFYSRAMRVPFAMAIVKLADKEKPPATPTATSPITVYLAGGTRSNWQDIVTAALPEFTVLDPRSHHLADERAYTAWDLEAIRRSTWILAHLEATNPGGYNLALELGYAKALGKKIILIDEKSAKDHGTHRHTGMLRATADITPHTLDEAITFLKGLPRP